MQTTIINVTCDGENCEHVRAQDSNHWLVGECINSSFIIIANTRHTLAKNGVLPEGIKDFCGEQCAIKWVSKMLTEIKQ